ncbi:MAG: hypothetical protein RIS76_1298 [Verrucomicrobiota bacterium]|jgi:hypothetical protein
MKPITASFIATALTASVSAQHFTYSDAQQSVSTSHLWLNGQTITSSGSDFKSTTSAADWMGAAATGDTLQPNETTGLYSSAIVSQISAQNPIGVGLDGSIFEARIAAGWTTTGEARMSISFTFTSAEAFNYEANFNLSSYQPDQGNIHTLRVTSLDGLTVSVDRTANDNASSVNSGSLGIGSYRFEATSVIHGRIVGFSAGGFASPIPEPEAVCGVLRNRKSTG